MKHARTLSIQLIRAMWAFLLTGAVVALWAIAAPAFAQQQGDPPGRVGSISQIEGSLAFAPAGETEWADAPLNRPVTTGDRLWVDRGSRAELHLGSSVLHLDGQTFVDITALDSEAMQASLNDGTVNARVRELDRGENFEIDTPQLAFRAAQPGDYRIDVDKNAGVTRVDVRRGAALVYGANGESLQLQAGQQMAFAGQNLQQAPLPVISDSSFDRWAQARNRQEDESVAARYVPRDVVGYQQLDSYGNWAQDPTYGAVWYPTVTVSDWAPYRYGRWEYVSPWGWTWVDDAPWGFAPFHYGRWAQIGPRWAWVPGRIGPRPIYAPALVAFVGGDGGVDFSLSFGSSPGIGWFPLGPGEAWRPFYRTSSVYINNVNRYEGFRGRWPDRYVNQQRPGAWTSVRVEDFSRGRPVNNNWRPMRPADLGRAQVQQAVPALPQPRRFADTAQPMRGGTLRPPQLSAQGNPAPNFGGRQGFFRGENQNAQREVRPNAQGAIRENAPGALRPPVVEQRAHQPQVREQAQEERGRRMQMQEQRSEQQRVQREQQGQAQREHAQRQQQQQAAQERAVRQQQQAQERAVHQQQQAQERMVRQQEQAQRQQLQQQQREHEMGARRLAPPPPVQQHQEAPRQETQRGGGGGEGRGRGQGQGQSGNDEDGRRHGGRGG